MLSQRHHRLEAKGSEEEQEREGVMVIAGLLKDRVDVEKEPAMKKQRIQGYFENRSNPYKLLLGRVIP
ncbi:hypothetical protein RhiirB3_433620 [Rhizophagus irregularis]|nr:hypothetical protein RhiirB3_433620 [Rhizophagus irregularis]